MTSGNFTIAAIATQHPGRIKAAHPERFTYVNANTANEVEESLMHAQRRATQHAIAFKFFSRSLMLVRSFVRFRYSICNGEQPVAHDLFGDGDGSKVDMITVGNNACTYFFVIKHSSC